MVGVKLEGGPMIDPEAESAALTERSVELAGLLAAGEPIVERASPAVWAERRRLAAASHEARRTAAAKVAAGMDPGCVVGRQPPIRRVKTDWKGRDLDPFHGASVITAEVVAFWEHQRDVVAAEVEAQYRRAAEKRPYRPALAAAARGHLGVLRERQTMQSEGGAELEGALARYDGAFMNLRQGALAAQEISGEAITRLASLRRIAAQAELGDDDEEGFIANAIGAVTDLGLVDAKTGQPLVAAAGDVT
jgi:hypothetical protein